MIRLEAETREKEKEMRLKMRSDAALAIQRIFRGYLVRVWHT